MKILKCKICNGEVEVIGNDRSVNRKTKCLKCGHSSEPEAKSPNVIVINRRRPNLD